MKDSTSIKLGCDVLLLSAGFGTRLRPLTLELPKPIIPFCGKPLIEWNLELLARSGANRVFINLHYLPEKLRNFLGDGSRWNLEIFYTLEDTILDTGGGIKNIESMLESEYLITVNSDIVLDPKFDLHVLRRAFEVQREKYKNTLAMLVLTGCAESEAKIGIAEDGLICKVLDAHCSKIKPIRNYEYTGVQILAKELFAEMPSDAAFSITRDLYRTLVKDSQTRGIRLASFIYDGFWTDVGTLDRLKIAEVEFYNKFLSRYAAVNT